MYNSLKLDFPHYLIKCLNRTIKESGCIILPSFIDIEEGDFLEITGTYAFGIESLPEGETRQGNLYFQVGFVNQFSDKSRDLDSFIEDAFKTYWTEEFLDEYCFYRIYPKKEGRLGEF